MRQREVGDAALIQRVEIAEDVGLKSVGSAQTVCAFDGIDHCDAPLIDRLSEDRVELGNRSGRCTRSDSFTDCSRSSSRLNVAAMYGAVINFFHRSGRSTRNNFMIGKSSSRPRSGR